MKQFIIKCALLGGIFIAASGINYSLNLYFIAKNPPIIRKSNLILGDSHPMTALNDQMMRDTRNLSQLSEPYSVTYLKLKEVLKFNEQIDTIYLGFSYHNLSSFNDKKFLSKSWCDELFGRIYPISTLQTFSDIKIKKSSYLSAVFKNMMLIPKTKHHQYLGHFSKRKTVLDTTRHNVKVAIDRHYFIGKNEAKVSPYCLNYLDSIISLSKKNKITLVAVTPPLHRQYLKNIPTIFQTKFQEVKQNLQQQGILTFDYSTMPLLDAQFDDYDHVNFEGSKIVTNQLIQDLKNAKARLHD